MRRSKAVVVVLSLAAVALVMQPSGFAQEEQRGLAPEGAQASGVPANPQGQVDRRQDEECTFIDFEGVGDFQPVGTVSGVPNVTFGPSWLGLVDGDAGGGGNFANEPSPDTVAFFLEPADPIDFDTGVQFIQVFYVASAISVPVTLEAWDGPGGSGALVDSAVGNTVGTDFDGAPCTGDPTGNFCLWDVIELAAAQNNILSITLSGATANQFAFDDMLHCTGIPGQAPALPGRGWVLLIGVLVLAAGALVLRRLV